MVEGWTAAEKAREAEQGAQPSGDSGELAQGEDSARLDAVIREALKDTHIEDGTKSAFNTVVSDIVCAIQAARASAETGGVKP